MRDDPRWKQKTKRRFYRRCCLRFDSWDWTVFQEEVLAAKDREIRQLEEEIADMQFYLTTQRKVQDSPLKNDLEDGKLYFINNTPPASESTATGSSARARLLARKQRRGPAWKSNLISNISTWNFLSRAFLHTQSVSISLPSTYAQCLVLRGSIFVLWEERFVRWAVVHHLSFCGIKHVQITDNVWDNER